MDKEKLRSELDALTVKELDARFYSASNKAIEVSEKIIEGLAAGSLSDSDARSLAKQQSEWMAEVAGIRRALKRKGH